MHAISSYRGNRPTNIHTNTPTNRTDYIIHCAAKLSRVNIFGLGTKFL